MTSKSILEVGKGLATLPRDPEPSGRAIPYRGWVSRKLYTRTVLCELRSSTPYEKRIRQESSAYFISSHFVFQNGDETACEASAF
jgi:hypothetical protein